MTSGWKICNFSPVLNKFFKKIQKLLKLLENQGQGWIGQSEFLHPKISKIGQFLPEKSS